LFTLINELNDDDDDDDDDDIEITYCERKARNFFQALRKYDLCDCPLVIPYCRILVTVIYAV